MDKLPWANPFGAAFGISYTLRRDKEATIQPKTIHIDERPLFRDVQTSMQGKRTPVHPVQRAPSSRNCCSSSLIPASLHATGETGSRYQLQAHGNQYSMENQTLPRMGGGRTSLGATGVWWSPWSCAGSPDGMFLGRAAAQRLLATAQLLALGQRGGDQDLFWEGRGCRKT